MSWLSLIKCFPWAILSRFSASQKEVTERSSGRLAPEQQSTGTVQPSQRQSTLQPPKKPERRRGKPTSKAPPNTSVDDSIREQLSERSEGDIPCSSSRDTLVDQSILEELHPSPVTSVGSKRNSTASSVTEAMLSETTSSQVQTELSTPSGPSSSKTGSKISIKTGSKGSSKTGSTEYAQDTFESIDITLTPLAPGEALVATSTPITAPDANTVASDGPLAADDYTLSDSLRSISGE
jgi:hypothetical protein